MTKKVHGFAIDWWVKYRRIAPVRHSLNAAFADQFYAYVEDRLAKNQDQVPPECPASWEALRGLLRREVGHFNRKRNGLRPTDSEDCLATAIAIDLQPRQLIPEFFAWLEDSVAELCGHAGVDVPGRNIAAFVEYNLRLYRRTLAQGGSLVLLETWFIDPEILQDAFNRHTQLFEDISDFQAGVECVANLVSCLTDGGK